MIKYVLVINTFFFAGCFNCKDYVDETIRPKEILGIVQSKMEVPPCHGKVIMISLLSNKTDTLEYCLCAPFGEHWDEIEVGDTIVKAKAKSEIQLHKKDTIIEWGRFPCCDW